MYRRYRKGVFGITYSTKPLRYLLLHRELHWKGWEFTKGGKKAREKLEKTCRREIKEETGLKIKKIKRLPFQGKFNYNKKAEQEWKAKGFEYVLFACQVKKDRVKIDKKEHNDYKWCNYSQAMKLLRWPNQKKCLKIVNSFIKQNFKKHKN